MPRIKYFGGNQPASIKDHVYYEDPDHPSYRGREDVRILIQTRCEDECVPREEWGDRFYAHIADSPYEGMSHVSGVGSAKAEHLRPLDQVIPEQEYQDLKKAIVAANEAYKKRQVEDLLRENDPSRRARPEDEALGWRTRVLIESHTELTRHVPYRVDDSCRAYARMRQSRSSGMTIQLIDLYHRADGDIGQAALDGLERAERFTDLLALAGFGAASVLQVVGTSPPSCHEDVPFNVATFQARLVSSAVPVSAEALEVVRVDTTSHLPLRHLREGLSSRLPTASLASFWNALERQADEKARELGLRRVVRCRKCGDEREAGWDIKSSFEAMYEDAGVEAAFDRHRSLRGRIQHGDAVFSNFSPAEFFPEVSRLQKAATTSVSKRVGLLPQTRECPLTSTPVTVFNCVVHGDQCQVESCSFEIGAISCTLRMRASANRHRDIEFGVDMPPKLDPLVLPPVIRTAGQQTDSPTPST